MELHLTAPSRPITVAPELATLSIINEGPGEAIVLVTTRSVSTLRVPNTPILHIRGRSPRFKLPAHPGHPRSRPTAPPPTHLVLLASPKLLISPPASPRPFLKGYKKRHHHLTPAPTPQGPRAPPFPTLATSTTLLLLRKATTIARTRSAANATPR